MHIDLNPAAWRARIGRQQRKRDVMAAVTAILKDLAPSDAAPMVRVCFSSGFVALWLLPGWRDWFSGLAMPPP